MPHILFLYTWNLFSPDGKLTYKTRKWVHFHEEGSLCFVRRAGVGYVWVYHLLLLSLCFPVTACLSSRLSPACQEQKIVPHKGCDWGSAARSHKFARTKRAYFPEAWTQTWHTDIFISYKYNVLQTTTANSSDAECYWLIHLCRHSPIQAFYCIQIYYNKVLEWYKRRDWFQAKSDCDHWVGKYTKDNLDNDWTKSLSGCSIGL